MTCLDCATCPMTAAGPGIHYEIHATVRDCEVGYFQVVCGRLGLKPVVLDLQARHNFHARQLTTSDRLLNSTDPVAHDRARWTVNMLQSYGLFVARIKIETVPWHPLAKKRPLWSGQYFEAHLAVSVDEARLPFLRAMCESMGARVSRSARRGGVYFVTLRRHEDVTSEIAEMRAILLDAGYASEKPIVEFALSDSDEGMDAEWMK